MWSGTRSPPRASMRDWSSENTGVRMRPAVAESGGDGISEAGDYRSFGMHAFVGSSATFVCWIRSIARVTCAV